MATSDSDVQINIKVGKIINKIQLAREKLEKTSFYAEILRQMQNPEFVALVERVISIDLHHSKFQVVLYGIGRMDFNEEEPETSQNESEIHLECNRMQLCLAILLREHFHWVKDIVLYDPVLSKVDQKAIQALGCTCLCVNENGRRTFLSVNENCRRTVDRPTLFFMPNCNVFQCGNVLEANWTPANLNKIIILGKSFKDFKAREKFYSYHVYPQKMKAIFSTDNMLQEIPLPRIAQTLDNLRIGRAFADLSWHFFHWDGTAKKPVAVDLPKGILLATLIILMLYLYILRLGRI